MRQIRAQSAMEYLMTYGWAILIIAVVLAVLFSLGIFNSNTYGGRAHAGSCTVQRPYGPGTTQLISLAGVCNGQLPQFVALFNGNLGNGVGSYIDVPYESALVPSNTVTITMWIEPRGKITSYSSLASTTNGGYTIQQCSAGEISGNSIGFWINNMGSGATCMSSAAVYYNKWYFIAVTYNGVTAVQYMNSTPVYTQSFSTTMSSASDLAIGGYPGATPPGRWNGSIADLQIYNTALPANDISALYLEGIGGAPINLPNLVGWWPLNGDGNDYSGNGYNGALSNVIWTSQWTNGYVQP